MTYRSDIDGLRAVAVLLVMLFHLHVPGITGGFLGVDVFYVISGYLITSILREDIEAERFSLLRFYNRRVRRIIPALVAIYLFCIAAGIAVFFPSDLSALGKSVIASAFFVSNFLFHAEAGYFAAPSIDKPLLHTWSLSVEEQFYVFWPLLMLVIWRLLGRRGLLAAVAAGALASLAIAQWQLGWDRAGAFFLIPARAWELAVGGLLALSASQLRPAPRLADLLSLAGLGLIAGGAVTLTSRSEFPGLNALGPCLGTALLLVSGLGGGGIVNRLFSLRPLVYVGLISYSLYLWHWPLIVFARYFLDRDFTPTESLAVIASSFVAAALSYHFVERPFRQLVPGRQENRRTAAGHPAKAVGIGLAAVAACAGLGATLVPDGWSWRLPENALQVDRLATAPNPFREACHGLDKVRADPPACTLGVARGDAGYDLLVIGDSHAEHLVPGLDAWLKQRGRSGRQVTTSGCPPLLGVRIFDEYDRESCKEFTAGVLAMLDRHPEAKIVVLAARWAVYSETRRLESEGEGRLFLTDERDSSHSRENSRRVLAESLQATANSLTARGYRVLLMGQVPPLATRRTRCVTRARWLGRDESACYEPAARTLERLAYANAVITKIADGSDRIEAFFPGEVLCDSALCRPVLDGVFLFRDEDHLNPAGSELLLRHLKVQID